MSVCVVGLFGETNILTFIFVLCSSASVMEKSIAVTLDSANESFQSMGANVLLNIILEIY